MCITLPGCVSVLFLFCFLFVFVLFSSPSVVSYLHNLKNPAVLIDTRGWRISTVRTLMQCGFAWRDKRQLLDTTAVGV